MSQEPSSVTYPTLTKAPIVQVAVELRTEATKEWSKGIIEPGLLTRFPEMHAEDFVEVSTEVNFQPGKVEHTEPVPVWKGVVLRTPDRRESVQFRSDAFVMTRSAPYPGWEAFVAALKERWAIHREISGAETVTRFGIRFINRIVMGTSPVDIDDFIHCGPKDFANQKLWVVNFLHRDQMLEPSGNYFVQIIRASNNRQLATEKPSMEYGVTVDIDVYTAKPWSATEELEGHLEAMRVLKNKVFFGSITEKAMIELQ